MQKRMDVKIHTQWCLTCIALTVAVMYMYTYQRRLTMNDYEKLDWISFAIQEAMNGNDGELMQALELVEELRKETNNDND